MNKHNNKNLFCSKYGSNFMKTIILAGGYGTRLGDITVTIPKPMVKIGSKPILWHIMKIYSTYGFDDFIISLGYKSEIIKEYFLNFSAYDNDFKINIGTKQITYFNTSKENNWKVSLIDTGIDTLKGARIKRLEDHLCDVNMVTYGDGLADININELLEFHKSHGKIITISGVHPPARFGEISENNGKLMYFKEKPWSSSGLINGGFMVFNKELLQFLSKKESCDLEKGPLETLAKLGEVMIFKHKGKWECIDHGRDIAHLNKLWNENNAFWKIW